MGGATAEAEVHCDHTDHGGESDEDLKFKIFLKLHFHPKPPPHHGSDQVAPEHGNHQRCRRHDVDEDEEEDRQRDEYADTEGDLVVREVEDERGEEGDQEAGDDQVAREEEGLPAKDEAVSDVYVLLRPTAGGVEDGVALGSQLQQVPLGRSEVAMAIGGILLKAHSLVEEG